MDKITKSELFQLLYSNLHKGDSPFEITKKEIIDDSDEKNCEPVNLKNIEFTNCVFSVEELSFKVSDTEPIDRIFFSQCTFTHSIDIEIENAKEVIFSDTLQNNENSIQIGNGNIIHFFFGNYSDDENSVQPFKGNLTIYDSAKNIFISELNLNNEIAIISIPKINVINIEHCSLSNIDICTNEINKLDISHINSKTLTITNYKNKILNINNLSIDRRNQIGQISLKQIVLEALSSFQDTRVNTIKLDNVQFNDRTYFDDFKILEPTKCDKITHRIIKQELQKTENRIDFDKFRSYELEAYKKELSEKENWYHGDLLILRLNSLFSKHGVNWKRAIGMTILFSLGFYIILYIIKNFQNDFDITLNGFDNFTSGYFKFFLVTNFYDPLSENKEYLSHFIEWFFFLLGKITIGYGLFETVQSFRKYKK